MSYNFDKESCDRCGITKTKRDKLPPMATGINHPTHCFTKSFQLGFNGSVLCPECSKEKQLESLMKTMDAYAEKHGEKALARKCGIPA